MQVQANTQHGVKGAPNGGETDHHEAEKKKKSISEMAEMLECTGELGNSKKAYTSTEDSG